MKESRGKGRNKVKTIEERKRGKMDHGASPGVKLELYLKARVNFVI